MQLYQRACDGGSLFGCANLAGLYLHGQGVARDLTQAARLYRRACEVEVQGSCDALQRVSRARPRERPRQR